MHILICTERLLFRFGLDRALLILGKGLIDRGHQVTFLSHRFDQAVVEKLRTRVIQVPPLGGDYLELDELTRDWLTHSWDSHFASGGAPDVVLSGGWPFFSSIPACAKRGVGTVFVDCGAVPTEGYSGGALDAQLKVRELRGQYLPQARAIASISAFIRRSQSELDAPQVPQHTVLLGADHMYSQMWTLEAVTPSTQSRPDSPVDRLRQLKDSGRRVVLNLGRWEPGSYKGSDDLVPLAQRVLPQHPEVVFAVLAEPGSLVVPASLNQQIVGIGFPDDQELVEVMRAADLGVTLSRWEGFNLPLAEMQLERRPVLALDLAAHPEVIADPWFLCPDLQSLGNKLLELLGGGGPDAHQRNQLFTRYAPRVRWSRTIDELESVLIEPRVTPHLPVVIDVTNATRDPANTGVMRVTRRLASELQGLLRPIFVVWDLDLGTYVLPSPAEAEQLSAYHGPKVDAWLCSPAGSRLTLEEAWEGLEEKPTTLLLTETVMESYGRDARAYARRRGLAISALFYDAIPVLRPDLCHDSQVRTNHGAYMRGLAECDQVLPISGYSAECLTRFWREQGLTGGKVLPILLPGEFPGVERATTLNPRENGPVEVLCVSTLEPRKNHALLLQAFQLASAQHPELDWRLTLVGNSYSGGDAIRARVEEACRTDPRIRWLGVVDDPALQACYAQATFTVYPSEIEGFGLPILESLWNGKPCLCHQEGVMGELATGGGCLTANVKDVNALAGAMASLALDPVLREQLTHQALLYPILDWPGYARRIAVAIAKPSAPAAAPRTTSRVGAAPDWKEQLYPGAVIDTWQMNDSERMTLIGLLAKLQPECSIEVGSYHGGSLSVLTRHSKRVFSIDIDPTVPKRLAHLSEVSFLTGPSQLILPSLLSELDRVGIPVEFVLIDGDHSGEGVRKDVECLLDYVPKRPMFVLMHDGFNPDCRRGILAARWDRSPYVHSVDVDFVPGRVVEHGGGGDGEMWGGLAMAYFDPQPRTGTLQVQQTSIKTFERAKAVRMALLNERCAS